MSIELKCRNGRFEFVEKIDFDPTLATPGSDEKIEILAKRAAQGKPLFHPRDKNHNIRFDLMLEFRS
jgi:hypothetical protein